ncbi:MAG TPA: universal stress protein [Steroidobacteraceae bacterium]|jgi:universal stress protein A
MEMLRYKKILLLLDLTDASEQVAVAGREIAENSVAEIVVLHVVEFLPMEPMGDNLLPISPIDDSILDGSRDRLAALAQRTGLKQAKIRVEAGNTKAEILRVAEQESVDLIVLGSRERHGLAILVNLTEDTVLHAAHCDVLAVRLKPRTP